VEGKRDFTQIHRPGWRPYFFNPAVQFVTTDQLPAITIFRAYDPAGSKVTSMPSSGTVPARGHSGRGLAVGHRNMRRCRLWQEASVRNDE
jgi:hypothetical protein